MIIKKFCLKVLYPIFSFFYKLLKLDKDRCIKFFVELNNRFTFRKISKLKDKPKKILLLMPHCLQFSDCEYRITGKVIKCKMCGKCEIKDLMEISKRYNVKLSVATGGTMARNIIKNFNPQLIIATACERDLISGLIDTINLPVIGILNERPYGPCLDTRVDLEKITSILESLQR
ncbi:MAG: DUF116 domain-containing protein [Proteobacteria bacterium]|nr:DUF116 domain-containing protein [Pseudomonadota bacterium]